MSCRETFPNVSMRVGAARNDQSQRQNNDNGSDVGPLTTRLIAYCVRVSLHLNPRLSTPQLPPITLPVPLLEQKKKNKKSSQYFTLKVGKSMARGPR